MEALLQDDKKWKVATNLFPTRAIRLQEVIITTYFKPFKIKELEEDRVEIKLGRAPGPYNYTTSSQ